MLATEKKSSGTDCRVISYPYKRVGLYIVKKLILNYSSLLKFNELKYNNIKN